MNTRVFILGSGAFAEACGETLKQAGAEVNFWLPDNLDPFRLKALGRCFHHQDHPDPRTLFARCNPDLIIPSSIGWMRQPWAQGADFWQWPILCPAPAAARIERDRDWAANLCRRYGVATPLSFRAADRREALQWLSQNPGAYVVKNPVCAPDSPIQAIVCDTHEATQAWIEQVDDREGIFLQQYMGDKEAGHFVAVSQGEYVSLVTNQEYKCAHTGNLGPLAQTPLAGIAERDPDDRYGLAEQLIEPLKPWFKASGFNGILQVTGIYKDSAWHAIEYNVRLGVTTGPLILQMLANPVELLTNIAHQRELQPQWRSNHRYGASLSLAGYGYPHRIESLPELPVTQKQALDSKVWWHHVRPKGEASRLFSDNRPAGPMRLADLNALGPRFKPVIEQLYQDIAKLHCQGSYYRIDLGDSMWPPGQGHVIPRELIQGQRLQADYELVQKPLITLKPTLPPASEDAHGRLSASSIPLLSNIQRSPAEISKAPGS